MQITYATFDGHVVLATAYSHELPQYGVKAGLTHFAAGELLLEYLCCWLSNGEMLALLVL